MAEGEHGFLGLTHNPFTDTGDDFFEGADRKVRLDQLRHLTQWSRDVMLVTGPQGVGKTMLYRQLSKTLEPRVRAARINGLMINSAPDVLAAIVQGFGAPAPQDNNPQNIASNILTYVIGQDRQGRFCLVMVDDAHRLSFQALEELLKLARSCPVRLLLFGEPSIVAMVAKSADRLEVEWHESRLSGFATDDIQAYLTWRFEQAQYRDKLPFSSDQLGRLGRVSGGLPGEINRIAGELVARLESGEAREGRRFPVAHRLLVVLLIALVGLAYLVFSDTDARREQARDAVAEVTEIPLPGVEPPPEVVVEPAEVLEVASIDDAPAAQAPEADAPGAVAEEVAKALQDVDPVEAPAAQESEMGEPETEARPVAVAAEVVESAPAAPAPGGVRDAAWLRAQPGDYYTMQLVSVSSEERVHAFVERQRKPSDFAWYTLRRGDKTLYVITYGLFATVEQARAAAADLPKEVGNLEPWIRQLKFVQEASGG
jgi:DamX protein